MEKYKILYINRAGVPNNAPGIRIYNVGKILRDLGHEVLFYCDKPDYEKDTMIEYDGFNYHYSTNYKNSKMSFLTNIHELVFSTKSFKKIQDLIEDFYPDIIILYNDIFSLTNKLIRYCEGKDIRLIADVTEWYGSRKSSKIGDKIVPFLTNQRIKRLDKKVMNIISITPYLENYYINNNCNTMFLPPVFDIESIEIIKYNYYSNYVVNLVYAGVPGNKDIINPMLDAISSINTAGIKIRMDLVGIDENYLGESWRKISYKSNGIFAHGRLSHEKTLEIIKKADFGVLLRRGERYAKAGFSTKFSECMSNGVAMICNSVGGADLFVNNMDDGIVVNGISTTILERTLRNILNMQEDEIIELREKAYNKSTILFERKNYNNRLKEFIESLR